MSKVKRVVRHPKLYLAVGGKLTHVPAGTEVMLTEDQAKGLGAKVADPTKTAAVELSAAPSKPEGPSEAEVAAKAEAEELAKRLAAAEARAEKAEKALVASASKAK